MTKETFSEARKLQMDLDILSDIKFCGGDIKGVSDALQTYRDHFGVDLTSSVVSIIWQSVAELEDKLKKEFESL